MGPTNRTAAESRHLAAVCEVSGCSNPVRSLGLCGAHYFRARRHGDVNYIGPLMGSPIERLLNSVEPEPNSGCWLYIKTGKLGYGTFWLNGSARQAHRAAWTLLVGPIPDGMQVNHKCHVRCCVNPNHLYLGTQTDNMKDMRDSGRERRALGELNGLAKLTIEMVKAIRKSDRKNCELAAFFSVAPTTISAIRNRKRWAWVDDE